MTSSRPCTHEPTVLDWEATIDDLLPLSTQLLTPVLATAFSLPLPRPSTGPISVSQAHQATAKPSPEASQARAMSQRPAGSGQLIYHGYFQPQAQTTLPPQPPGNLQSEAPAPPAVQPMMNLGHQLQNLGVQQKHLFGLKGTEATTQLGPQGSGQLFTPWLDPAVPSGRTPLPQAGQKHTTDANIGSDPDTGEDQQARALKRPRLVWTAQLHQRFVDAVKQLGLKSAVPKTIMQLMNVDGLTRENVASHLQKYRLQLRKDEGRGDDADRDDDEGEDADAEAAAAAAREQLGASPPSA